MTNQSVCSLRAKDKLQRKWEGALKHGQQSQTVMSNSQELLILAEDIHNKSIIHRKHKLSSRWQTEKKSFASC